MGGFEDRVGAVIPAAGYSSRMGALKPLLPFGSSTAVETAVDLFLRSGIRDVVVVLGYRAGEIVPVLDARRIRWVLNHRYGAGMFSSVLAGMRCLGPDICAFFVLPVDLPGVRSETVGILLDVYQQNPHSVIRPRFGNRRGHPPLVPVRCVPRDIPADLPGGLRTLLRRYRDATIDVEVPDEGVIWNCNTPEEYRRIRASAARQDAGEGFPRPFDDSAHPPADR